MSSLSSSWSPILTALGLGVDDDLAVLTVGLSVVVGGDVSWCTIVYGRDCCEGREDGDGKWPC